MSRPGRVESPGLSVPDRLESSGRVESPSTGGRVGSAVVGGRVPVLSPRGRAGSAVAGGECRCSLRVRGRTPPVAGGGVGLAVGGRLSAGGRVGLSAGGRVGLAGGWTWVLSRSSKRVSSPGLVVSRSARVSSPGLVVSRSPPGLRVMRSPSLAFGAPGWSLRISARLSSAGTTWVLRASPGMSRTQPGRIRSAMCSREPSGCSLCLLSS